MRFIERYEQGSDAYHIPYLVALDEVADLAALVESVNAVVQRHPVLKSVYLEDGEGETYQQILEGEISLRDRSFETKAEFVSQVKTDIAKPFDLGVEPSVRLHHYEVAGQATLLFCVTTLRWTVGRWVSSFRNYQKCIKL